MKPVNINTEKNHDLSFFQSPMEPTAKPTIKRNIAEIITPPFSTTSNNKSSSRAPFFDKKLTNTSQQPGNSCSNMEFQQELTASQKSHRMRLAHLQKVADRIGVDGLAVCGDQNDLSFFDEYNFEGLMNEPWYERIKGNEM